MEGGHSFSISSPLRGTKVESIILLFLFVYLLSFDRSPWWVNKALVSALLLEDLKFEYIFVFI